MADFDAGGSLGSNNNADLGLALYCAECNLRFADQAKLARHKEKFCVGTKYFDPQALHNALHRDEKLKTMSFQDVRVSCDEVHVIARRWPFVIVALVSRRLLCGVERQRALLSWL
jgi:hypothetical protein